MAKRGTPEWLENVTRATRARAVKGEKHGAAILTEKQVKQIRARHAKAPRYPSGRVERGWVKELAEELGISPSTLNHAIHGQTWSHLNDPNLDRAQETTG